MTDHRPGHHNSVKKQARDYQREHPGTSYTAALAAVTSTAAAAARSTGWEPLVRPEVVGRLDALVLRYEEGRRVGEEHQLRAVFTGHAGTGKTTAAGILARKLGLAGPVVWASSNRDLRDAMDAAEGGVLVLEDPHALFALPWDVMTHALTELADRGPRLAVIWMQYNDGDWDRGLGTADDHERSVRRSWVQTYLDTNFVERVVFPSLSAQDIVDVLAAHAADAGYVLTVDATEVLDRKIIELSTMSTPNRVPVLDRYGNARFGRATAEAAIRHISERTTTGGSLGLTDPSELTPGDVIAGVDATLEEPLRQTYLWIAGPQA